MGHFASVAKVLVTVGVWMAATTISYQLVKSALNLGVLGYTVWANASHALTFFISLLWLMVSLGVVRFIEKPVIPAASKAIIPYALAAMFWFVISIGLYYWVKPAFYTGLGEVQSYMGYVANIQGLMISTAILSLFLSVGFFILLEKWICHI